MVRGFDCATPLTPATAAAFARDGCDFVGRYLVPSGWKRLTTEEVALLGAAGLRIVSVHETTADRALGGGQAGRADGEAAVRTALAVGQPPGSAIYFAVDFDATPAQLPTVIDYIRGASEATPGYLTGVYGSFAVIEAVRQAGVCSRFWQTYAWSRGCKAEGIHLYQYHNDVRANGVAVDWNEGYGEEGGWGPVNAFPLTREDANEIIERFLRHEFDKASLEDQIRRNDLANALRKASGQPLQLFRPS